MNTTLTNSQSSPREDTISLLDRAKTNDQAAIATMFRQFVPEDEGILFAEYLGQEGFWWIGSHSFACLSNERVASIRVASFGEMVYQDGLLEDINSSLVYQPSRLGLAITVVVTCLMAIPTFGAALLFLPMIVKAHNAFNKSGTLFCIAEGISVFIFCDRKKLRRANELMRLSGKVRRRLKVSLPSSEHRGSASVGLLTVPAAASDPQRSAERPNDINDPSEPTKWQSTASQDSDRFGRSDKDLHPEADQTRIASALRATRQRLKVIGLRLLVSLGVFIAVLALCDIGLWGPVQQMSGHLAACSAVCVFVLIETKPERRQWGTTAMSLLLGSIVTMVLMACGLHRRDPSTPFMIGQVVAVFVYMIGQFGYKWHRTVCVSAIALCTAVLFQVLTNTGQSWYQWQSSNYVWLLLWNTLAWGLLVGIASDQRASWSFAALALLSIGVLTIVLFTINWIGFGWDGPHVEVSLVLLFASSIAAVIPKLIDPHWPWHRAMVGAWLTILWDAALFFATLRLGYWS